MKLSSSLVFLLALSSMAIAPLSALARPPGGQGPGLRLERLDLSTESQAEVDAILDGSRSERRALRRELRTLRENMRSLMKDSATDEDVLFAQAERLSVAELAVQKHRIATHLQLRDALTEAQLASLFEGPRGHHDRP